MPPPADAIIPAHDGDGEVRSRAAFARLARSPRPLLLFVTHGRGGGVARHVRELAALVEPAADVLVLRPYRRSYVALEGQGEHHEARRWFHREQEWDALCALLRDLGVARVHVHHVQGLPERALALGRELGCPWDVTVHDYYPICPQYQLTDGSGRYCGEPDEAGCGRCLAASPAQWPMDIVAWRAAFRPLLEGAARVISPSHDAARRIARYAPGVRPVVWPHPEAPPPVPVARKVLVLGALSPSKGMQLVLACARDARDRALALEFRVVGHLAWPVDTEPGLPLSFTGEYREGELAARIASERGDAIFFPAQWPETWSYTLSAAIDAALPIVATDLGAFPERLSGVARARLLPWQAPASHFNDALIASAGQPPRLAAATAIEGNPERDPGRYLARYLEGLLPRRGAATAAAASLPGLPTAPDEWIPEATLAELFDDGVRAGNGASVALLRERVGRADALLAGIEALRERLSRAEERLADAARQAEAMREEAGWQRAEANTAAARIASLEASTSWRLTAPLRALARRLRR